MGDSRLAPPPLRDCNERIVESALAAPQEGFGDYEHHPTLAGKAAVLGYRVIKGHPCPDGNKRLALLLVSAFLELNGHDLEASGEEINHIFRTVAGSEAATHDVTLAALANWMDHATEALAEEEDE